jgi:phosphatidylglycerol:prolipoprotein diacylglycerol transferase
LTRQQLNDLVFWGALGVILGGRVGYVLFYAWEYFVKDPITLIRFWEGGMSFHGGLIGVLLALLWASWRFKVHFFRIGDFVAPLIPIGLGEGRMGTFINGELYGRVSDLPWAMSFGQSGIYRHPSQLYQFFLEGVVLFAILWWFSRKPRPMMSVSALFLVCYGVFRFAVEFFREPDAHIGYLGAGLTMGQWLSLPMIVGGGAIGIWLLYQRRLKSI